MAVSENESVSNTLADPQFKAGRSLVDAGRLEEAVDFFSSYLEVRVDVLGDEMSPALAPLYYEYGNALLYNAEESGAVFGDAITEAEKKRALALVDAAQSGSAPDAQVGGKPDAVGNTGDTEGDASTGENGTSGSGEPPAVDQEAEQDLILAWENLEIARRLYNSLELTDEIRTLIAKVHLRLGDLQMVNGMYNEAAEDFATCLTHRLALPSKHARGVADAHVRKAQALFYSSTLKDAKKDALVTKSLEQYRLAAGVLEKMISTEAPPPSSSTPAPASTAPSPEKSKGEPRAPAAGSKEELQDVLDTIRETIETMSSGKDMEALAEYKSGAASSTSVGFGASSGSGAGSGSGSGAPRNAESGGTTAIGFSGSASNGASKASSTSQASSSSESGAGAPLASAGSSPAGGSTENVLQVKRKARPGASKAVAQEGGNAAQQPGSDESQGSVKRARTEG